MINMYEEIRGSLHFNEFDVGEMLLVEYSCPIEDESAGCDGRVTVVQR
jgi:hypothetical protein